MEALQCCTSLDLISLWFYSYLVEFLCGSITICIASSLKHSCPRGMTTRFDPLPCRLTPQEHMRTLEDETDHVHSSLASSSPYIGIILRVSMVVETLSTGTPTLHVSNGILHPPIPLQQRSPPSFPSSNIKRSSLIINLCVLGITWRG